MPIEYLILIAFFLDFVIGDPPWLPHPVRFIGWTAAQAEERSRRMFGNQYIAGFFAVLLVLAVILSMLVLVRRLSGMLHSWGVILADIYILYSTFATRDLIRHSMRVYRALKLKDLDLAREEVGMIVGRQTSNLDEEGVSRACVESVAESIVDGITAPLFWAAVAGPAGALLYRAVNTLDSTYGYKNDRYRQFGWTAARLDDLLNYLPARISAFLVMGAALILRLNFWGSYKIWHRDRTCHASPNSGHTEAAVAGALGVRLGGPNIYFGQLVEKPFIGDPAQNITADCIAEANRLMITSVFFAVFIFAAVRHAYYNFII